MRKTMGVIKSPTQIREEQTRGLISLLNNIKDNVDEDRVNLKNVVIQLIGVLERFYDPFSTQLSTATKLKNYILILEKKKCSSTSDTRCNVHDIAEDTISLIDAVVEEVKAVGLPDRKTACDKSVNVNTTVTQNQEQSQKQSQEVNLLVDLLKNSLAPYQLEELKEVAKSDMPTSEKRQTLMDKILSFGSNVGASVLANILTNPAVYSCL